MKKKNSKADIPQIKTVADVIVVCCLKFCHPTLNVQPKFTRENDTLKLSIKEQ